MQIQADCARPRFCYTIIDGISNPLCNHAKPGIVRDRGFVTPIIDGISNPLYNHARPGRMCATAFLLHPSLMASVTLRAAHQPALNSEGCQIVPQLF